MIAHDDFYFFSSQRTDSLGLRLRVALIQIEIAWPFMAMLVGALRYSAYLAYLGSQLQSRAVTLGELPILNWMSEPPDTGCVTPE